MSATIPIFNSDDALCCPRCGSHNLHQGSVEVFNRRQEDGPSMAVLIPESGAPIAGTPERNPSARRQGVLISFWCESCGCDRHGPKHVLEISQHKGSTYLAWRTNA